MNKWIVALLVGLAMLVLISPGIIGRLAERDLNAGIDVARIEEPDVVITTDRYERGWFASEGQHRIELDRRPPLPALIVNTRIEHGLLPIATLSPGVASMRSTLQVEFSDGETLDLPGDIVTTISLNGETKARVDLQSVKLSRDSGTFDWQGAKLEYDANSAGRLLRLAGAIQPSVLVVDDELLKVGRIEVAIAAARGADANGLPLGTLAVTSDGVIAETRYFGSGAFTALSVTAESEASRGKFQAIGRFDVRGLVLQDTGLGGQDDNIEANVELLAGIEGFDVAPLSELYAAWRRARDDASAGSALAALYPQQSDAMQRLVAGGGSVRIERLALSVPAGRLESDMLLSLPPMQKGDAFSWPGLFLKLEVAVNLTLAATLFDALAEQNPDLRAAVDSAYLVREGDDYTMSLVVSNGRIRINGTPVTIPMPGWQ